MTDFKLLFKQIFDQAYKAAKHWGIEVYDSYVVLRF